LPGIPIISISGRFGLDWLTREKLKKEKLL